MAINASAFVDLIIANAVAVSKEKELVVDRYINAAISSAKSDPVGNFAPSVKVSFKELDEELDKADLQKSIGSLLNDYSSEVRSEIVSFENSFNAFVNKYLPFDGQMSKFGSVVQSLLEGQTGIPTHVEDQIWQRDRARVLQDVGRAHQEIIAGSAARGFPLPTGAALYTAHMAQKEGQDKIAQLSRDVAIKHVDMLLDGIKTAMTNLTQMRSTAIAVVGDYVRGRVSIGGNVVPLLTGKIDAETRLLAVANDYYRTRLDGEKAVADVGIRVGEINKDVAIARGTFAIERQKYLTETISRAASALSDQAAAALNAVHASAGVTASGSTD